MNWHFFPQTEKFNSLNFQIINIELFVQMNVQMNIFFKINDLLNIKVIKYHFYETFIFKNNGWSYLE